MNVSGGTVTVEPGESPKADKVWLCIERTGEIYREASAYLTPAQALKLARQLIREVEVLVK